MQSTMELSITNLYGINILSKYPKKNDLINYLNQLHKSLSKLNQEPSDRPKALKNLSLQLVSKQLLSNNDKEVRLLTTCCIVDILRIFAPDAPFNNEDTIVAFDAINQQLRGLSTYDANKGVIQSKAFYILSSISTFQSCVVPVILSQNGIYGASETVIAMFEAILSSIRIEHPEEVFNHASSIFQACIEESEGISEDLLDVLLLPLLSNNKTDNPAAYQLAFTVLRRVSTIIQMPISSFLNRILVGSSTETVGRGSELTEHIYSLLYELHRVSPELLNRVIPNLCLQLQVEEEDIRLKAVKLLGSLFASSHAEYAKEFSRNFRDYLSRFNDLSPEIRLEMVENCTAILQNKTILYSLYEEPMVKRLRDADERVRLSSLTKLIDISYHKPLELCVNTYIEMGERVKDKRIEIKRTALVGLAKLYSRHVTVSLPPLSNIAMKPIPPMNQNHSIRELVDSLLLERFEFVPSLILKCWSYPEINNKYLVIQLLQEQLLPKENIYSTHSLSRSSNSTGTNEINLDSSQSENHSFNTQNTENNQDLTKFSEICERRATALLLLFECLSNTERNFLAAILCFKAKARVELHSFLTIHSNSSSNNKKSSERQTLFDRRISNDIKIHSIVSSEESMKALRKCIIKFMQLLPANDKKASYLEKLYTNKDRIIFRLLDHCIGSSDSITESIEHREDLKKRLDSKSSLSEYMSTVYDVAGSLTVNSSMIQSLLNYIQKLSVHNNALLPSELLVLLSKHCPYSFQGNGIQSIAKWLDTCISYENNKNKQKDMKAILFSNCYSIINHSCHAFEYEENQSQLSSTIISHLKKINSPEICVKLAELCSQIAYYSPDLESDILVHSGYISSLTMIQELFDSLTTSKVLNTRNKRLDCDLSILVSLCTIPKAIYTTLNFTKPSFISMMDAILSKSTSIINFITEQIITENNNNAVDTYTLSISLKLLTNILCTKEELHQLKCDIHTKEESTSSTSTNSNTNHTQDSNNSVSINYSIQLKKLIILLFECIESKGEHLLNFNIENIQEKDFLFETAATCTLTLMKLQSFTKEISIDQWHNLGWTFLHTRVDIRQRLLHILNQIMQLSYIHPKFLAYSCLFAMDSDVGLTTIAEQGLYIVIKRLRVTHEELCSLAIEKQEEEDNVTHQSLQKNAEHCMPEAVLPYLLHLLSYHPDFPTSIAIDTEEDKKRMKNVVRCVHMLLKVLKSSLTSDSDNMSYLFKQLNTINQQYVDKHDSDNIGLHFVTRMAVKLLNEQIKTSDNLQVYPGDIHLPIELYQRKVMNKDMKQLHGDGNVVVSINMKEGLEDAEQAIDKVLQFANKGNKAKSKNIVSNSTIIARTISHKHNDITGSGNKSKKKLIDTSPEYIVNKDHKRVSYSSDKDISISHNTDDVKLVKKSKLPIEIPTRNMPKRNAKENISYMIPIDNDREMLKWEEDASKTNNKQVRTRLSSELYGGNISEFSQHSNNSMNKLQRLSILNSNSNNNIEESTDTEFVESQESGYSFMKDTTTKNHTVLNSTTTNINNTTSINATAININNNTTTTNNNNNNNKSSNKNNKTNHNNDITNSNVKKINSNDYKNKKKVELPISIPLTRNTRLIRG